MKKRRLLFLFWASLIFNMSHSQSTKKIDSLKFVLAQNPDQLNKTSLYNQTSKEYILEQTNNQLGSKYADSAFVLATRNDDKEGVMQAFFNRALIKKSEGEYEHAIHDFNEFVAFHKKLGDSLQVADGLYNIGIIHNYLGEFHKNLAIQFRILNIYEKAKDKFKIANSLRSIGNVQRHLKNFEEALKNYEEATSIYHSLDNKRMYAACLGSIGNVHFSKKEYHQALKFYHEALNITQKNQYEYEATVILNNLGATYEEIDLDDKALQYHLEALDLKKKFPDMRSRGYSLDNVGYMYYKMQRYASAEQYFNEALSIAKELGAKRLLMEVYQDISDLHMAKKDFEKAYDYNVLYNQTKDSIFNEENANQINELQTKYATSEKEKEIALLINEKEIQEKEARQKATRTNAIIGGLAAVLLLAILLFYLYRQRVRNQKIVSQKNAEITEVNYKQQLSELEMKALRAQMNPHFVFNCLNSINRMILGGDIKDASRYLTKFSRLIRKVLENSEKNMVSVIDELTMLKAYIQLESLRFKGKISYKTEIDKNIDLDTTFIPSMVLQPLVENAIWHGLMHKEKGGTIKLSISKDRDILKCSIEDDGVGRKKNMTLENASFMKEKSMGLQLTAERLKIMGEIGLKRFIEIIDLKNENDEAIGTRVDLLIPIE